MRFLFSLLSLYLFFSVIAAHPHSHPHSHPSDRRSLHYSPTPIGPIRSDCIHTVPSGSKLSRDSQGKLWAKHTINGKVFLSKKDYEKNKNKNNRHHHKLITDLPSDYNGWTSYTAYNSSVSFDSFLGYFSVPDAPASSPDILYVFTGLQNIDWIPLADSEASGQGFDIIQPVLQYPADSGIGWSVKSWYVTLDEGAVNSAETACQQGDNVFGNMTRISGNNWYISTECSGGKTEISHSDPRLASQPWAYNTLECYGCSGCSTYPTIPIAFTKLSLTQGADTVTPRWVVDPKPSKLKQCKEKSTINSPDNVVISFQ